MTGLWQDGDPMRSLAELEAISAPTAYDLSEQLLAGVWAVSLSQEREVMARLTAGESVGAVLADVRQWARE
jgi:hypothetical protein